MFPIRDDNPQLQTPFATYGLIAINVLAWFLVQGFGANPALSESVCNFGLVPAELLQTLPAGTALRTGPNTVCVIGADPSWASVLTSMFMHGSWMHIIGNMWFLWIFGDNVEDSMGHAKFLIFYVLCGIAAAAAQTATNPASPIPMVGASGAIGGVMGAYILLFPRVHVHMFIFLGLFATTVAVPAILMLGYWFAIQLASGFLAIGRSGGGVAFWAHVGGFVAGALLVMLFRDRQLLDRHPYHGWKQKRSPTRNWHRIGRR
jgi:membrane associated rhomboid family serine protease